MDHYLWNSKPYQVIPLKRIKAIFKVNALKISEIQSKKYTATEQYKYKQIYMFEVFLKESKFPFKEENSPSPKKLSPNAKNNHIDNESSDKSQILPLNVTLVSGLADASGFHTPSPPNDYNSINKKINGIV